MKCRSIAAVVLAAACAGLVPSGAPASDTSSVYGTLATIRDHSVLFVAVGEGKMVAALKSDGPYTLFAPSDAAFKKLDDATVKKLATDKEAVRALVRGHVASGEYTTKQLAEYVGKELRTLDGETVKVEKVGDGFRVGGAKVVRADVRCNNGVIHVLDAVLPAK